VRWLKALRTQLVLFAVSVLICELALQFLAAFTPVGSLLGRPSAIPPLKDRGHDTRGYRNVQALATADVVVLGDSQSYGTSVSRDEAWPTVVTARTGLSVYNMARAGYGPGHNELQLAEALTLKPRAIVVGFYFGNDLFDAFALARGRPAPPGLEELAREADALEREEPLEQKASRFFNRGRTEPSRTEARPGLRVWLRNHVMLYALAREVRNRIAGPPPLLSRSYERAVAALTPTDRAYVSVVDGPAWRTILTAPYRRLVLDQRDPRILLGFERAVAALESIAAGCRSAGVELLVVLIPTKESVFWPRIQKPDNHPQLHELIADEAAVRDRLLGRLQRAGIDVIDILPALRASVEQPYLPDADGHPSPAGHAVIAQQVAGWVIEHAPPRPRIQR
jgi:hypothetical protein